MLVWFLFSEQEAVARLQHKKLEQETPNDIGNDFGLDNLDIGPPISKGCAAVVYAASYKNNQVRPETVVESPSPSPATSPITIPRDSMSPIQNMSRFVHNFGLSVDNLHFNRAAEADQRESSRGNYQPRRVRFDSGANQYHNISSNNSTVQMIPDHTADASYQTIEDPTGDIERHPLALKMMFNYDIQSNAMAILRAMHKETIPAVHNFMRSNEDADSWERSLMQQTVDLPPHPNIVTMYRVFCAQVPNLMDSASLYPMALPPRINPNGYGRNMSLFLLMKRYNCSLYEYLQSNPDISMRTRLMLFAQLLEGAAHLYRYGIAHRDLKSDNILIDCNKDDLYPVLVLSDFGCCLADKNNGLCMQYPSFDIDKGGNTALMAPEIICKTPGTFAVLDYSKSDLWACGAMAYEIFGVPNPFYEQRNQNDNAPPRALSNTTYKDTELPELHADVPLVVRHLVSNLLKRNPSQRLSADIAANVMELFLWAPSGWHKPHTTVSSPEILQWLLSLTTKILYEGRLNQWGTIGGGSTVIGRQTNANRAITEYQLISSFLIRSRLELIRRALQWIQQAVDVDTL